MTDIRRRMTNPYSPLKVYVAARWDDRPDAVLIKTFLEENHVLVTSTWLTDHDNQSMDALKARGPQLVVKESRERAVKDFEDIDRADCFLQYSPRKGFKQGTGGKHVEMGYAMARGKSIFIMGERENIFHYHPTVRLVDSVASFLRSLEIPVLSKEVAIGT
jgi:nucleoside 2-deoxyribosyltransferase